MRGPMESQPRRLTPDTKLRYALDLGPDVLDYVVSLRPHDFARLRNPFMRRLMSPRISLARVARMAGVPAAEFVRRCAELGGAEFSLDGGDLAPSPVARPDWVPSEASGAAVEVNLLDIDRSQDADPFPPISAGIKKLAPGQILLIRHMWEPQPLYDVWEKTGGLAWYSERRGADEWWIWVLRPGT